MNNMVITTLVKKDLKRVFSDISLFISTFIMPTILIIAMFISMTMIISMVQKKTATQVYKIGIVNCPQSVETLIDKDVVLFESLDEKVCVDIANLIDEKDYCAVLIFDADFEQKLNNYEEISDIPSVSFYYNRNESDAIEVNNYLSTEVLGVYEEQILSSRVTDDKILTPYNINYLELGSGGKPLDAFVGMVIPLMLLFLLTHAAVSLGIDLITTEKEKNTLLGYLLLPIRRSDISISKCITLIIITVFDSIIMMTTIMLAFPIITRLTLGDEIAMTSKLNIEQLFSLVVVLSFTTILITSIVCFISALCKSTKIASGVSVLLYVFSIVSGFVAMFSDMLSLSPIMDVVPYFGNAIVIQKIIVNTYNFVDIICIGISDLLIASMLILVTSKLFTKEKFVVNI